MSENLIIYYSRRGRNYVDGSIRNSCRGAVLGAGLEVQGTATARSEEKIAAWAGKCTG